MVVEIVWSYIFAFVSRVIVWDLTILILNLLIIKCVFTAIIQILIQIINGKFELLFLRFELLHEFRIWRPDVWDVSRRANLLVIDAKIVLAAFIIFRVETMWFSSFSTIFDLKRCRIWINHCQLISRRNRIHSRIRMHPRSVSRLLRTSFSQNGARTPILTFSGVLRDIFFKIWFSTWFILLFVWIFGAFCYVILILELFWVNLKVILRFSIQISIGGWLVLLIFDADRVKRIAFDGPLPWREGWRSYIWALPWKMVDLVDELAGFVDILLVDRQSEFLIAKALNIFVHLRRRGWLAFHINLQFILIF